MKIAIVCNLHVPLNAPNAGGMELAAYDFIRMVASSPALNGVEFIVVANEASNLPENVEHVAENLPSPPQEFQTEAYSVRSWIRSASQIALENASSRLTECSLIHDHSSHVAVPLIARRLGIPCVRTLHLMPCHPDYAPASGLVDAAIHLSNYQAELDRWHCQGKVVQPFLPCWDACKCVISKGDYAVSVGRVEEQKGHHAAARLAAERGLSLKVVGETTDKSYALRLERDENVQLLGALKQSEVFDVLRGSQLLIWVPLVNEPFGRVVVEALVQGTIVLGKKTGIINDICSGVGLKGWAGSFDIETLENKNLVEIKATLEKDSRNFNEGEIFRDIYCKVIEKRNLSED